MKFTPVSTTAVAIILGLATSALAGHNCKCQDPSGTGPQWDEETEQVCNYISKPLGCIATYHGDQHHQCSTATNCLDSGRFNQLCQDYGLPGAYCW